MLSVLLIWIFILITTFVPGFLIVGLCGRKEGLDHFKLEDISICGLMAVTVYGEFFSLFSGVGILCRILLLIFCLAAGFLLRKKIGAYLKEHRPGKPAAAGLVFLVLLMAYGGSRGYFHFDSDLYHGQSVRWIEEYGVVPGLANLHVRLAYNSAAFVLTAVYSFVQESGQSYHAVASFLALLVGIGACRCFHILKDRSPRGSDLARIATLYYICNIFDEMVSPASDYFVMLLFFHIVTGLLELYEKKGALRKEAGNYAVYALLAVFVVTVKLSAAAAVLVVLIPLYMFWKERRFRTILRYALGSLVIALPFMIRNYILSGRILYPSAFPDIFHPVWKVNEGISAGDTAYIIGYGKGFTTAEAADYPLRQWFPVWWGQLGTMEKLFFAATLVSVLVLFVSLFLRKKAVIPHIVEGTVLASVLFWFVSAPLIRYGLAFLICFPFVMLGELLEINKEKHEAWQKGRFIGCLLLLSLFLLYKGVQLGRTVLRQIGQPYYLSQQDYGHYETEANVVDGTTIYTPLEGNQCGYEAFPSAPEIFEGLHLLGDGVEDGFCIRDDL